MISRVACKEDGCLIVGIGLDIVEIDRFGEQAHARLTERILTPREREFLERCESPSRRQEFLAGRFAVKEAVAKAFGTGIGKQIGWQDIEVLPGETGNPTVVFATQVLERLGQTDIGVHVSITHSRQFAVAQVIVERT